MSRAHTNKPLINRNIEEIESTSYAHRCDGPGSLLILLTLVLTGAAPLFGQTPLNGANTIGVYRDGAQGLWVVDSNGSHNYDGSDQASYYYYGTGGNYPIVGDWDGSGQLKIGVFSNGYWYMDMNGNGAWEPSLDRTIAYGLPGDIPVVGDWLNDGKLRIGVFRVDSKGQGWWYVNLHTCAERNGWGCQWGGQDGGQPEVYGTDYAIYKFGLAGDIPVVGDWDHTGRLRIGVFRNGVWVVDQSGCNCDSSPVYYSFGARSGDLAVVGRWTDPASSDPSHLNFGVFRGNGMWVVDGNGDRAWETSDPVYLFGTSGDIPVMGPWSGAGQMQTVQPPTISPAGGTFSGSVNVTITSSTPGASINYPTDGTTPTSSTGIPNAGQFTVTSSMTIKAIAFEVGYLDSGVSTAQFTITSPTGDFAIQANPSVVVPSSTDTSATFQLSVIPINGFSGTVNLVVDTVHYPTNANTFLNCGTTGLFFPSTLTVNQTANPVTQQINPYYYGVSCLPGHQYYLHLIATSGQINHQITLEMDIPWTSDFSISAASSAQTLNTPGTAYYQFLLHRLGGFSDQVVFSVSGLPAGATATFTPSVVPLTGSDQSVILKLTSAASISNLTVTATGQTTLISHGVPLSLVVQQGAPTGAKISQVNIGQPQTGNVTFQWTAGSGVSQYRIAVKRPDGTVIASQPPGLQPVPRLRYRRVSRREHTSA